MSIIYMSTGFHQAQTHIGGSEIEVLVGYLWLLGMSLSQSPPALCLCKENLPVLYRQWASDIVYSIYVHLDILCVDRLGQHIN